MMYEKYAKRQSGERRRQKIPYILRGRRIELGLKRIGPKRSGENGGGGGGEKEGKATW